MHSLYLATAVAGVIYILTPGPGMIALFATVASSGRATGIRYLGGELIGDVLWSALGMAAVLGMSAIGPVLSDILGVGCGLYLVFLGWRAMTKSIGASGAALGGGRPFKTGLIMGVSNPKSYPVFVALFAAVMARYGVGVSWSAAPRLIASTVAGFLVAHAFQIAVAGLPVVRASFLRHRKAISRCVGVIFVLFGGRLTLDSTRDLAHQAGV